MAQEVEGVLLGSAGSGLAGELGSATVAAVLGPSKVYGEPSSTDNGVTNGAGLEREVVELSCELISHRGSWPATAAGCSTLGQYATLAVRHLCATAAHSHKQGGGSGKGGGTVLNGTGRQQQDSQAAAAAVVTRSAEVVLAAILEKRAAGKLCRCIQDAQVGAAPGAAAAWMAWAG